MHFSRTRSASRHPGFRPAHGIVALAGLVALQTLAQTESAAGTSPRGLSVSAGLAVSETLTNNVRLSATDRRSELITQLSPSLRLNSTGGRVKGSLNYTLNGFLYARESSADRIQHALSAAGTAEVVDNFAFVDASANISRQNLSAFGTTAPSGGLLGSNQADVKSWSVSPHVKGQISRLAGYEGRISYSQTDSGSIAYGRSANTSASLRLGSLSSGALLDWSVLASRQETDFSLGRQTETDQLIGTLGFAPSPEWRLSARAGREISNLVSLQREGHPTYGLGVAWTPSPRTSLAVDGDHHFYGNTYSIRFQYRTPRTAWAISDVRSVLTDSSPFGRGAGAGTGASAFELLFMNLTSRYPDPIERAQQALLQLLALGIDPTAPAPSGFLTSAASLQHSQQASVSYLGLRTNLVLSTFQTRSSRLDPLSTASDSLSGGVEVRQRGISASASHRLTPSSTLTLNVTLSRTPNAGTSAFGQDFRTITLAWQDQITRRMRLNLSARHTRADSTAIPYDEAALIAALSLQF